MNRRTSLAIVSSFIIVLAIAMLGFMGWVNFRFCQENPGGNDFLVHWTATRNYLLSGISPYGDETSLLIQRAAYGRPALPGEHELRFAYPFYSLILFFPFALIKDFTLARAIYMTVLQVCLLLLTFFSIRMVQWRPKVSILAVLFLFSLVWYHAIRPFINGNAVILVALGLVACLMSLKNNLDEMAGFFLALSTIKPQVVFIFILFILFWALYNRRGKFIAWFLGCLLIFTVLGIFFLPDWILQNLREIVRYPAYNPPGTPGAAFALWLPATGKRLGYILTGVISLVLLLEWWLAFRRRGDIRYMVWTACLTLTFSQWIGIQTDPGNFIVLMPAFILALYLISERYRRSGTILVIGICLLVLIGLWLIFISTVEYGGQPQQSPIMFFPMPGFLLILLYWVRWWALKPSRIWFDRLEKSETV